MRFLFQNFKKENLKKTYVIRKSSSRIIQNVKIDLSTPIFLVKIYARLDDLFLIHPTHGQSEKDLWRKSQSENDLKPVQDQAVRSIPGPEPKIIEI